MKHKPPIEFNRKEIEEAHATIRAIRNPLRQRLLCIIKEEPGINVTDLYIKARIEQSVASQHLRILRRSGLVFDERRGKNILYWIDEGNLELAMELIKQFSL